MHRDINLLARRPVKILQLFEVVDVVLFVAFVFVAPFLLYVAFQIPFSWSLTVSSMPVMVFIFRFRIRRREGYFQHWVDYKIRPRFWFAGFGQRGRWDDFPHRCFGYRNVPRVGKDEGIGLGL